LLRAWRIAMMAALTILGWKLRGLHRIDILIDAISVEFYFYFFLTGMLACLVYRALAGIRGMSLTSINALAVAVALALFYLSGWSIPRYGASFHVAACRMTNSEEAFASRLMRSWFMAAHRTAELQPLSFPLFGFHVAVDVWLSRI